jgi:hypothetical protein
LESLFLRELAQYDRILLVGAGGGFDIYSGVPLFEYLTARGKDVWLSSLSFSNLKAPDGGKLRTDFVKVTPDTPGDDEYFPERYLSQWYADQGREVPVYSFYGSGARTVYGIYGKLKKILNYQALVLVDGGTDSLMRGDEPGLGSPAEDIASIAAAHMLEEVDTYLINLGFGVDYHHEVCHVYVLEAIADLTKSGDFLGAFSLLPGMPEFDAFCEVVDYTNTRMTGKESIVASSILAAGKGEFGDYHHTDRVKGQELFINPLMSLYWCFRLKGVAERCLYLDYIIDTHSRMDVHRALSNYLYTVQPKPWKDFPH